ELTNRIDKLKKDIEASVTQLNTWETELAKLKNRVMEKDIKVDGRAQKLEERHQLRNKYKVLADYQKLTKQQEQIAVSLKEKEILFKQAEKLYQQYEASWLQNQAVILASHLHDGDACPVCGSMSHPQKAVTGKNDISQETLEAEKNNVSKI